MSETPQNPLACLCAHCEKIIRGGDWTHVSHGICPECVKKHFPSFYEELVA